MPDPNHERLRRLFDSAIDLPPEQREAFLDRVCSTDLELRDRLLAMLAAADDDRFLSVLTGADVVPPTATAAAEPPGERPGSSIGPYLLLQQIGEGGFGTVFLAAQSEPVQRRVALKIVKLGMDTRQVVLRFEQERQALALMDHPNIARVLDAGATATGRPYFVMDLVPGEPITTWCDRHNLSIAERLRLFAQVCDAVQHAHGKGIIHRDLKPTNILVALQDGRPLAKVIDFGIAKATALPFVDRSLLTEHRQVLGTLLYMSPEQAAGSPDIDTRSDVYSLGVLLYELLTGSLPFDRRTVDDAMLGELQRLIREIDPPRPSTRLSEARDTLASVAAHRRIEPRRLGTLLRGDIDWIVMKALEKDRARRYQTANGLALDIQRHLGGDPVLAAPPSANYRLRKFVRRNRGAVTAIAAVVVVLVAGVVGFAWQFRIAVAARNAERTARGLADERAASLAEIAGFQQRLLGQIDATATGLRLADDLRRRHAAALAHQSVAGEELTARTATFDRELREVNATDAAVAMVETTFLRPAVAAVEQRFGSQPLVAATLRQTLATLYVRLGRYDRAHELQAAALATRERLLGAEHVDTARAHHDLANVLEKQGHFAAAEPHYRKALAVRRSQLGDEHPETLLSLGGLGGNLRYQCRFGDAEPLLRQSLELSRRVVGDAHRDTLIHANVLGYLFVDQGRFAEAEPYWRETYEVGRKVFGPDDPDAIVWTNNLGGLLASLGRLPEAERLYLEAWHAARRVHGEAHPETLQSAANIASNLIAQGRAAEAEPLLRETLDIRRRTLGDEHPDTLGSLTTLGSLLRNRGALDEAEAMLRSAWTSSQRVLGRDHLETVRRSAILASTLAANNQPAEAETLYQAILAVPTAVLGDEHPDRLIVLNNLGGLLLQQHRLDEAEPLLRTMLAIRTRVSGRDHPETLIATSSYARLREDQGHLAEAEALYRDATTRFRAVLGDRHANTASSIANVGGVLLAQRRFSDAEPWLREAVAMFVVSVGETQLRTAGARRSLGRALAGQQRFVEAEIELLAAERIVAGAQGSSDERKRTCCTALVALYEAWHAAEPGAGKGAAAAQWQAKVDALPTPASATRR